MRLERLRIQGLRCLADAELQLGDGLHMLAGANGAGKTSVLEAAFLLSHGRSFRSGARDALLQRGAVTLSVFGEWRRADDRLLRLGLGRNGNRWEARIDGEGANLGELVQACAVVCFEPGSHALIAGSAEERRRFLDWGVFHVEHAFLPVWRRYQRALKQRNSLLRSSDPGDDALFAPWEAELVQCARQIDGWRSAYLQALSPHLQRQATRLLPELGPLECRYRRGWADDRDLGEVLASQRGRDVGRGHTGQGAHRADWAIVFEQAPMREHLSRGQEKLTAMACLLAQAALFAERNGEWPLVCLDDLASELDEPHQHAVLDLLQSSGAQVLVTGTDVPAPMRGLPVRVFHVEHGQILPA
ncbi:DNA replication/repair protein RecF [Fulvimonas sp. R45]|uniref:DNA replication/repair protein RecF n=1 Tax=Fulvimonas sp. R45 TaxID=3045937 RepID=UPI00265F7F27|nr:DNA replication/repair protein RecF [Fulvimonas sp. R45]MDO1529416.1 DNA replication/repair protein RecF [Fulvimonas sp. R45]